MKLNMKKKFAKLIDVGFAKSRCEFQHSQVEHHNLRALSVRHHKWLTGAKIFLQVSVYVCGTFFHPRISAVEFFNGTKESSPKYNAMHFGALGLGHYSTWKILP